VTGVAGYSSSSARPLTPRMRDVLAAAGAGLTRAQTALALGIAEPTVATERKAACARLGAPNVTAAVLLAARRGELL
jgi:DNA-binding CsgD family transcriptional regulator